MSASANSNGDPEFQVAPMIDVLLTLLVFFMTITSAQVLKVDTSIHLPSAKAAVPKEKNRNEAVLNVRWVPAKEQAEFNLVDATVRSAHSLVPSLKSIRQKSTNPLFRVVIRGDQELPTQYIREAMEACAQAGVSNIAFATSQQP